MALTDYRPTGDRILLEKIERPKTELIIRVAPSPNAGYALAKVIAMGPLVPQDYGIEVGDTVALPANCGEPTEIDGEKFWQVSIQRNDPIMVLV